MATHEASHAVHHPRPAQDLLAALRERVLLADAACAPLIYERGIYINQSFEALNQARPHLVKSIHLEFLRAGADLLTTNTFSANRFKLERHGLADKVREINQAGARLAREAAGSDAWVAGVAGPPGEAHEGSEDVAAGELRDMFAEQIEALLHGGADAIMLASFSHLPTLAIAAEEAKRLAPEVPCIALVHLTDQLGTRFGDTPEAIGAFLEETAADIVGLNDGPGAPQLNAAFERMRAAVSKPFAILPGAGLPVRHEDLTLQLATPEYFMEILRRSIVLGARLVGGSCGLAPGHIRAIKSSIKMLQPGAAARTSPVSVTERAPRPSATAPTRFAEKVRAGKFVVSIEIDPPAGTDAEKALDAAEQCAREGIDCINIADGPRATARMGPIDMAILLGRRTKAIEPIVHFCCRDRNILGLQADLIGANALGIHNVLVITGDPPKLGDYPFATAVYDVDAIGALGIGSNLNRGLDLAGNPLKGPATNLFLGCGANPGAIDLDNEIARLERKVAAGAEYVLTQPVYDSELFERFWRRVEPLRIPILIGILPLASYRNAEFLTKEVPGMQVPDPILDRMRACRDREAARAEGIAIARESLAIALPHVQGVYVMPPFNRIDSALEVLEVAKSRREG